MADIRDVMIVVLSELCMFFMRVILDNPNNKNQEISPNKDATDSVPPNGSHGVKDTPTTTDTHEGQGSTGATQVEMLVQPANFKLKKMLDTLFEEVCLGLKRTEFFESHDAPSFFVVYAHDNSKLPNLPRADSRMVNDLIKYLKKISSKCRSDRSAELESDHPESRAKENLLENQFCLLPKEISETSVDKVLLFYSEVLQNYCAAAQGRKYVEALKTVGLQGLKELQRDLGDKSVVDSATAQFVKASIRAVVETHTRKSGFHHVLTEIGLISLRIAWTSNPYTVVAIDLHDTGTISDHLEFFGRTQHYVRLSPHDSVVIDQIERCHRLFFVLLERIYEYLPTIVGLVQQQYQEGFTRLQQSSSLSLLEFQMTVRWEITEEFRKSEVYAPRRTSRLQKSQKSAPRRFVEELQRQSVAEVDAKPRLVLSKTVDQEDEPGRPWKGPMLERPDSPDSTESTYSTESTDSTIEVENENEMYQAPPHVLSQAMRETLVWLTDHTTYQEWLLRDNGLLGLRGGPGSGKSTALNHLLQEARREERNTHTVLSFSFQNQEGFRRNSRKRMYGNLLYNLMAEQSKLETEFREWTDEDWKIRSSADDFRGLFLDVVTKALEEGPIRIFLDSLDEAGDTEAREVIADLRCITRFLEGVATGLSICFTCRSYPSITVDNGLEIRLEQNNRNGIKNYVRSEVRPHIRDTQASDEFLETISAAVADNSMGNFLYAVRMTSHVIDLLARVGPDPDSIVREVNETPEIRMSIYRRILDQNIRNRPDGLTIAMTLIQLTQFSQREISVEELRCLLVSDESFMSLVRNSASNASGDLLEDEVAMTGLLKSYLADLVEIVDITDQSGTIRSVVKFAKASVAEWIWRSDEMASAFHTYDMDWRGLGHDRVARACYNFIKVHRRDWNNLNTQALKANLDYATTYWFDHAAIAEAGGVSQAYLKDLLSGKEGRLVLQTWAKASGRDGLARRCLPSTPALRDIAKAFYIPSLFE
ncbi:hypothetical protein KCU95_g18888, partial [Aureobasidium melanogenum]